jgi:hypothetical protein
LHGGSNVGDAPALAVTGNYHDEAHHDLLVKHWCEPELAKRVRRTTTTRLKAMVKDSSCLHYAGILGGVDPNGDRGADPDAPLPMAAVVYDEAFCPKYGAERDDETSERYCAHAAATCPVPDPDDESDFVVDRNDNGRYEREEVALKFAEVSPRYLKHIPDADVTYADVRAWVGAEMAALWPLDGPPKTAREIDDYIRARFMRDVDAEAAAQPAPAPAEL